MAITQDFDVRLNDSGYVVFSHPHGDQSAYNYLEKMLTHDEIQNIFTTTFGTTSGSDTPQCKDWIVNNYDGIKKVAVDYAEKFGFRISNSVLEHLR